MSTTKNRLKALRNAKGLTQNDLAQKLNSLMDSNEKPISKMTVSNWENNKHSIKQDKAELLAKFFNVSVPYLLGYGYQEPLKYLVWQDNIANLRRKRGISQETLSKDTAIPLDVIKEWENNSGGYTTEQLEILEKYFKVPIPEIIGYSIAHSELRNLINTLSEDSKQKLLTYAKDLKALEDFNKINNP